MAVSGAGLDQLHEVQQLSMRAVGATLPGLPTDKMGATLVEGAFRVIVTGSRGYPDNGDVDSALNAALDVVGRMVLGTRLIVVHGACSTGGDELADRWTLKAHRRSPGLVPWPERVPADWMAPCRQGGYCGSGRHRRSVVDRAGGTRTICPAAGYYRNEEMVARGATACFSFNLGTRGTSHCRNAAVAAGIPTWEWAPGRPVRQLYPK